MKALLTLMLVAATAAAFVAPGRLSAQTTSDTLYVAATPPGNLDNVILGDTTATGQRKDPNRVYVLQQTGKIDSVYYCTEQLTTNFNVTVIGKRNPVTGHLPVIAPFINTDNSSPIRFFFPTTGNFYFKNLYFIGTRPDGIAAVHNVVQTQGNDERIVADSCVFDNFNNTYIFLFVGDSSSVYVTNCDFRDNQGPQWNGAGEFWQLKGLPMDTAVFVNNTFFSQTNQIVGALGLVRYFLIDHNTMFMNDGQVVEVPQAIDAVIKNNIFYGTFAQGMDSTEIKGDKLTNGYQGPSIVMTTPLSTLANSPYNYTEAERKVVVENNAYYWPKPLYDNWAALNDTASANGPGKIVTPTLFNPLTQQMFSDSSSWPGFVAANNDSVDPGFNSTLVTTVADSLNGYVDAVWQYGTAGGDRFFYDAGNPATIFSQMPSSWTSYPVPEDMSYSNTALQHAGTDGYALGDLNWFPSQKAAWVAAGGMSTGVKSVPNSVPATFELSNNYPNPFNPSTNIKVSLKQNGVMSLKIYNVLGELVKVVDEGYKPAGEYVYNVNMDNYASGVYFYSLREGANGMTKKMMLLK